MNVYKDICVYIYDTEKNEEKSLLLRRNFPLRKFLQLVPADRQNIFQYEENVININSNFLKFSYDMLSLHFLFTRYLLIFNTEI